MIAAARSQIGVTLAYDPSYQGMEFPGGDIPRTSGVCTDVVIRALRDAWGIDLQLAVNRDMKADFAAYPKIWGLRTTDRNIDHRRVPNLETLFMRLGAARPLASDPGGFEPGDIISWRLTGSGVPHIGIAGDVIGASDAPQIIHNIGWGTREEDMLFDHQLNGHFRLSDAPLDRLAALGS